MKKKVIFALFLIAALFFGCATTLPTDDGPDFFLVTTSVLDTTAEARTDVFLNVPYKELVFEVAGNREERQAKWFIETILSYNGAVKSTVLGEQIETIPYESAHDQSSLISSMYWLSFKGTPGSYNLRVTVTDGSTGKSQKREDNITLRPIRRNSFNINISDPVFLGDAVRGSDRQMAAFADPQKLDHQKPLRFAFVLYVSEAPRNVTVTVNYKVTKAGRDMLHHADTLHNIEVPREGKPIIIVRKIPDTLSSDEYLFELVVKEPASGAMSDILQKKIGFWGDWPNSPEEMEMAFGALGYLSLPAKAAIDEAPTKKEKIAIFRRAMATNDYGLNAKGVDAKEFVHRLNYANKNFSGFKKKDGWRTPRGRIYIKFGIPDFARQYSSLGRMYAYEVWVYSARPESLFKHRVFVFVNKYGEDYDLDRRLDYLPEWRHIQKSDLNNEW